MKDRFTRFFSFFCVFCLVLCALTIVSWARSSMNSEGFAIGHRYSRYQLAAADGSFIFVKGRLLFDSPEIEQAWREASDPDHHYDWGRIRVTWLRELGLMGPPSGATLGFGYDSSVVDTTRRALMPGIRWHRTVVQIPHWFVAALFGLGPGLWMYRRYRLRQTRFEKGQCRRCGFEMGNVYHSCPKCGERAPLPDGFPVIDPH
jgi:hypothetical protein